MSLSVPALAQTAAPGSHDTQATAPASHDAPVQEIVVTAERHNSTVQNTPISMTALSGAQLEARGIAGVGDIVREIPGLSVRSAGPGQTEYEARGLSSTGGAAPTVGFYFNDVPMSPPTAAQIGKVVIDPDLYDISSVEVLRGPQGTLYGSGSMGGTVRVVTNQPKLGVSEGSIDTSASGTVGGGGPNGSLNGAVNIPIGDNLAVRLVAGDTSRSGWIDRTVLAPFPAEPGAIPERGNLLTAPVQSVKKDANTENMENFRASALYKPSADTTITASVLYQNTKMGDYDEFDQPPGSSHLVHYEAYPIAEPIGDIVKIFSLTGTQDLGFATLTSDTAYWERNEKQTQDASETAGNTFGLSPYVPLSFSEFDYTRQFSEEVRLASPEQQNRFRWVVGAFYSDLHSLWDEYAKNSQLAELTPGLSDPGANYAYNPYRIQQIALFGDGTFSLTNTIKLSAGLRFNRYESTLVNNEVNYAFPGGPPPLNVSGVQESTAANAVTPRFNIAWEPNRNLTVYATASEGYRPGGLNQVVPSYCGGAPASYAPDSVWNYEAGEKARMFDGRLQVNADFYYDNWSHIQQALLLPCGSEYYDNAGNGRTFGPELEVTAKLTPEWTLSGSGAYTDAEITNPVPVLVEGVLSNPLITSVKGCSSVGDCTLPILNVPKYTFSLSLEYSTQVLTDYLFTWRLTDNYVGPVVDESFSPIINLPCYDLVNLRMSLAKDRWTATLFGNNLTNDHAIISSNNTSFQFNTTSYYRASTNQPLTAGIEIAYRY